MTRTLDTAPACITGRCPACHGRNFTLLAAKGDEALFHCNLCGNDFYDGGSSVARMEIARHLAGFLSLVWALVVGAARCCAFVLFCPLAVLGVVLALGGADRASWAVLDLWGWLVGIRCKEPKR